MIANSIGIASGGKGGGSSANTGSCGSHPLTKMDPTAPAALPMALRIVERMRCLSASVSGRSKPERANGARHSDGSFRGGMYAARQPPPSVATKIRVMARILPHQHGCVADALMACLSRRPELAAF